VHAIVKVVCVLHRETLEHQQHAVGQARPEAQAVGGFHVGGAADGRGVLTHIVEAEASGFFGKQAFQAFGAGEVKFETVRHEYSSALGYVSDKATHRRADVCPNALPASVRVAFPTASSQQGGRAA